MTYSTHEGYGDARRIDEILNELLQKHSVLDDGNKPGWHILIRTIHTSLNIIRPTVGLRKTGNHVETVISE